MKNKKIWIGACAAVLLALGGSAIYANSNTPTQDQDVLSQENEEAVVEQVDASGQEDIIKKAQDELDTEDIVVKITEDGFVTINGGHYHFHRGELPKDAIFSEELLAPASYQFNQADVVSEIEGGYVVKTDGKFYIYLENPSQSKNIRSKQEIEKQSNDTKQFVQDSRKERVAHEKSVAGQTLFGGRQIAGRYTTDDGYIFSPYDIIDDLGDGYLVPHDDHFHFIPKADLSPSELAASKAFWSGGSRGGSNSKQLANNRKNSAINTSKNDQSWKQVAQDYKKEKPGSNNQKQAQAATPLGGGQGQGASHVNVPSSQADGLTITPLHRILADLYNTPASQIRGDRKGKFNNTRHVEGDGLVFDPVEITRDTGSGYIIPHGDHYHVILYSWLSPLEQAAAEMVLEARRQNQTIPTKEEIQQVQLALQNSPQTSNDGQVQDQPAAPVEEPSDENSSVEDSEDSDVQTATPGQDETEPQAQNDLEEPKEPQQAEEEYGSFGPVGAFAPDGQTKATPLGQRAGKPNSQIVFSKEEIDVAKSRGHYTTSDGYVFDAKDIIEADKDGYITRHMDHVHYIPIRDLNSQEQADAKAYWASVQKKDDQAEKPSKGQETSDFDPKAVIARTTVGGKDGYLYEIDNQQKFVPMTDLDLEQRSFAELQLNLNSDGQYAYQIAEPKEGELKPGLYVPISHLPMRAGSASVDTGTLFSVPHIDHLHLVFYDNLSAEQIATIKYLMQTPAYRPAPWLEEGHDKTVSTEIKYVPNVTPKEERSGMKNWEIIHSVEEVNQALKDGVYATDDGYIFHPSDITDEKTIIIGDSWSIPTLDGNYRSISKADVNPKYHDQIDKALTQRKEIEVKKEKEQQTTEKGVDPAELKEFLADYFKVNANAVATPNVFRSAFRVTLSYYPNFYAVDIEKDVVEEAYHGQTERLDQVKAKAEKELKELLSSKEDNSSSTGKKDSAQNASSAKEQPTKADKESQSTPPAEEKAPVSPAPVEQKPAEPTPPANPEPVAPAPAADTNEDNQAEPVTE